jgi:hypothetical protein
MIKTLFFINYFDSKYQRCAPPSWKTTCMTSNHRRGRILIMWFKKRDRVLPVLFHPDGFGRADVNAGLAVDTHILIDFCLVIIHGDCRCGTFAHAGFTSGTFIVVNDCYQLVHSVLYVSFIGKKRVTIIPRKYQAKYGAEKPIRVFTFYLNLIVRITLNTTRRISDSHNDNEKWD